MSLDKLLHALKDIQVAMAFLEIKNSSFLKRVISRIVLIRLPDFIQYARIVNNETRASRPLLEHRKVKEELKALFELYEEFLEEQRNKFGGHFKDDDYFNRIEIWSEIQGDKLDFFYQHVLEISQMLTPEQSQPYSLEEKDVVMIEAISKLHDLENRPTLGNDILALSRYNTVSAISIHEIHAKPAILQSLKLIIQYEMDILSQALQPDLRNMIKALVVVDVVSFSDTLITRQISTSAKQYMEGLDTVVERHQLQKAVAIFSKVKSEMKLVDEIEKLREIRNTIGAHLDATTAMPDLLVKLQSFPYEDIQDLFQEMLLIFKRVCSTDQTLRLSQLGPIPIPDAIETSAQPNKSYDQNSIPARTFAPDPYTIEFMESYFEKLRKDLDNREALDYFGRAFWSSKVINTWERKIQLTEHAIRYEHPEYCLIHHFLDKKLKEHRYFLSNVRVIHRIITSRNNGTSHIVSKLLFQQWTNQLNQESKCLLVGMLGVVADVHETEIIALLKERINSRDPLLARAAFHSLALVAVKHNGIRRLNGASVHPGPEVDYHRYLWQQLDILSVENKIVTSLTLLSALLFEQGFTPYYEQYTKLEYIPQLEKRLQKYIPRLLKQKQPEILRYVGLRNYGMVAIMIGDALPRPKGELFYQLVADGQIRIDWGREMLVINCAVALSKLSRHNEAINVAEYLIRKNPEEKSYRLLALDFAAKANDKAYMIEANKQLENKFVLTTQDRQVIEELMDL